MESLYHFFPRSDRSEKNILEILESIFNDGIRLTHEVIPVPWKDYFGKTNRNLIIDQYRLCLTTVSNLSELIDHSKAFGSVGLEFSIDHVMRIGGFPVFYVPTPKKNSTDKEDFKGISLLHRIAEAQEILEYIGKKKLHSEEIDIDNVIGSIKFLGNICYPTNRITSKNFGQSNYYKQREWRIIYGLTSELVDIEMKLNFYLLKSFNQRKIIEYVKRIVVLDNANLAKAIYSLIKKNSLNIKVDLI